MDKKQKKCAQCGKPQNEKYKPFCSARCAQVDLGKWLNESYVVKGDDDPSYEDSPMEGD